MNNITRKKMQNTKVHNFNPYFLPLGTCFDDIYTHVVLDVEFEFTCLSG